MRQIIYVGCSGVGCVCCLIYVSNLRRTLLHEEFRMKSVSIFIHGNRGRCAHGNSLLPVTCVFSLANK